MKAALEAIKEFHLLNTSEGLEILVKELDKRIENVQKNLTKQ